jgi:hypothetical protein
VAAVLRLLVQVLEEQAAGVVVRAQEQVLPLQQVVLEALHF